MRGTPVTLSEGTNTVRVKAVSGMNAEGSNSIKVILDSIAPSVSVTAPLTNGTVTQAGAYTAPWTTTFNLRRENGTELFEYVCQQANYASELMVGDKTKVDRTSTIIP